MLQPTPLPAFADNYVWALRGADPGAVAVVDPGDAAPVLAHLTASGARLCAVLLTHHHADHVGGAAELAARWRVPVYGPQGCEPTDRPVGDGARVELPELGVAFEVLAVPGHTLDHLAFVGGGVLCCGDTLFSAGCGRLFEGDAATMTASLDRLAALPGPTRVLCGHEYTVANLRFATTVEPDQPAIAAYSLEAAAARAAGRPTLPSTIGRERQVNPFLRLDAPGVREAVARWSASAPAGRVAVFAGLRRWKDGFR